MFWTIAVFGILATSSALNLVGVPSDFTETNEVLSAISDEIATQFSEEYISYMKTGIKSSALHRISEQLANSHSKKDIFIEETSELSMADQFFLCTTCRAVANVIFRLFRDPDGYLNGPNARELTKKISLDICRFTKYQTEEVCGGYFEMNYDVLNYSMQHSMADSRSICGTLPMDICKVKQEEFNWVAKIDQNGPVMDAPKSGTPEKSPRDMHILQVTDIHYDPDYVVGSLADCDEPLCCRRHKDVAEGTSKAAGYWSDFRNCDTPLHMIDAAFDHMREAHSEIDYIYFTGDIVAHTTWNTNKEDNKKTITFINELMEKKFSGIPVYPCIGNHEPHPCNVFVNENEPKELSTLWLYEHLYQLWSKWLPPSTKETILKGGYYTFSPKKGFRIISMNNHDCYLYNWWIYNDGKSGMEQLNWLHDTLLAAEKAGEYVHILAHIPSGNIDCWSVWAREYNRIVERFSNTISAIFNGHTHNDDLYVHYSSKGYATAVSWNGGSLTSYINKNPNYRIYEVEPQTMKVIDYESWIFNLTEANIHGAAKKPVWYKDYQISVDFTKDPSPAGIDKLLEDMANNPNLLRKYWLHKKTSSDPNVKKGCNNKCLHKTICTIATTINDNKVRCRELQKKLQIALDRESAATTTNPIESTTSQPVETTTPDGGGAASLIAVRITAIIGLYFVLKVLF